MQMKITKDKTRFKVLACGRRWGKTRMCSQIAIEKGFKGKRVWWVAPTYQVARLGWREVVGVVSQFPTPVTVKEGAMVVEFKSGGFIAFKSADAPDNLRGEGLDYLIMDEADFVKGEVWEQVLRPALSDRKGGAIFISTPKVENGWFHKMFKKGQTGEDPEIKSWQFSSYDNPFMDPKELNKIREDTPSITFRQEYMAEFIGAVGARVQAAWLKYEDVPTPESRKGWKIALGADLAISEKSTADYTAVAVMGRSLDGIIHVLEVARDRLSFAEQIKFIKRIADKWDVDYIGIEDVAYQRALIQQLSTATSYPVRGVKRSTDKIAFFAPVEARYELGQVIHVRGLLPFFENELLAFPNGEHDDSVDALSIAFTMLKQAPVLNALAMSPVVNSYENGSPWGFGKRPVF